MRVFCDDSGKNDAIFVAAGLVSTVEKWKQFTDEWEFALRRAPALKRFKMNEAANRGNDRLGEFQKIVERHVLYGVACVIETQEFEFAFKGKISRTLDNPFFAAYWTLMAATIKEQGSRGDDSKEDFVFDEETKTIELELRQMWMRAKELRPRPGLSERMGNEPIFRNDEDVLPLQGADMLAWYVRRGYAEAASGEFISGNSKLKRLFPNEFPVPVRGGLFNAQKTAAGMLGAQKYSYETAKERSKRCAEFLRTLSRKAS
jgi:hypothetical protein